MCSRSCRIFPEFDVEMWPSLHSIQLYYILVKEAAKMFVWNPEQQFYLQILLSKFILPEIAVLLNVRNLVPDYSLLLVLCSLNHLMVSPCISCSMHSLTFPDWPCTVNISPPLLIWILRISFVCLTWACLFFQGCKSVAFERLTSLLSRIL